MTEQEYFHFDLTLTKTMLNKYTIDASKKVQDWYWSALEGDFGDMLRMEHDEQKMLMPMIQLSSSTERQAEVTHVCGLRT